MSFAVLVFVNLPVLVSEPSYGPFSWGGIIALFVLAFALGPIVARKRAEIVLD